MRRVKIIATAVQEDSSISNYFADNVPYPVAVIAAVNSNDLDDDVNSKNYNCFTLLQRINNKH